MTHERNAIIESARFDMERGLTIFLGLDYGDSTCQGFGGWLLYAPKGWAAHECPANLCGHWIYRMFEVAGVSDWGDLVGRAIRVRREGSDTILGGRVIAIGHITKDDWFDPKAEFGPAIEAYEAKGKS